MLLNMGMPKLYKLIESKKIVAYKDDNSNTWKMPAESINTYNEERLSVRAVN